MDSYESTDNQNAKLCWPLRMRVPPRQICRRKKTRFKDTRFSTRLPRIGRNTTEHKREARRSDSTLVTLPLSRYNPPEMN